MKNYFLITLLLISTLQGVNAQKAHRIGFVDMESLLTRIPEYQKAQTEINAKVTSWQAGIAKFETEIQNLKALLNDERAILTRELLIDREEEIEIKETTLRNLKIAYFGPQGDLFFMRRQLIKPIQNLVHKSLADIAKKRKYDYIIDKSSEGMAILYANKENDVTEIVANVLNRNQKIETRSNKLLERVNKNKKLKSIKDDAANIFKDVKDTKDDGKKLIDNTRKDIKNATKKVDSLLNKKKQ